MADEPNPLAETLTRVQTELTVTRAQHNDLTLKIRRRELIHRRRIEALVFARARRVRDQMLTAPVRHAAVLGAEFGLAPAPLAHALGQIMRQALHDLRRHPPKIPK